MLHVGLATWGDIEYSLHASAHVPTECLGQVRDIMKAAWPEEDAHLRKFSMNALVGFWSTREQHLYSIHTN